MIKFSYTNLISWLKKRKQLLLGLATIILVLIMAFLVDFNSLILKILIIGFWGTLLFAIFYTVAFLLRAYKLNLIFNSFDLKTKYTTYLFSLYGSFAINDLTPGKIGDLVKIYFIKDKENIKFSESVCGIAIERVLDFILLFSISTLALLYLLFTNVSNTIENILLGQSIQFYLFLGVILLMGILIGFILLIYKTKFVLNIVDKISSKLSAYLEKFLISIKDGFSKFKDHRKNLVFVILLGFPTWIIDAALAIIVFYFLGYQIHFLFIILATILIFFSKTIPITPGGWGISENIGALFLFIIYPEIPYLEILSVFLIDHIFRSGYLFLFGGYSIFHFNIRFKDLKHLRHIKVIDETDKQEPIQTP